MLVVATETAMEIHTATPKANSGITTYSLDQLGICGIGVAGSVCSCAVNYPSVNYWSQVGERLGTNSNEMDRQAGEQQVRSRTDMPRAFVCILFWWSLKKFWTSPMGMTKGSLSAGTRDHIITQAPIPILGEKVSKMVLPSSRPLAKQLALKSEYFIKHEVSSAVRGNTITLRRETASCQYNFLSKSACRAN